MNTVRFVNEYRAGVTYPRRFELSHHLVKRDAVASERFGLPFAHWHIRGHQVVCGTPVAVAINSPWDETSIQFYGLFPVGVELLELLLRLLELAHRVTEPGRVAVQLRRRERDLQLFRLRLGGGDVYLQIRDLAIRECPFTFRRLHRGG